MADDQDDLAAVVLREWRDDEALILAAPHGRDEPFLLQSVQGAAYGSAAQAQALRDCTLGDTGPRWQVAPYDEAAELLIDPRDRVRPLVAIDRAGFRGRRGRS